MDDQLTTWEGDFGDAYTARNVIDWQKRSPAFRVMLDGLDLKSILEVGCNRGHNLQALVELFGKETNVVGVEPNRRALQLARGVLTDAEVFCGNVYDLPFKDAAFDLVFTAGVLIHIPLVHLPEALAELFRVSRRYILVIEYRAEKETVIPYHGSEDLLWKRDFLGHYRAQFPDLNLLRGGYLGPEDGFDRVHWWLLEKHTDA